jgi:hypothetical protein
MFNSLPLSTIVWTHLISYIALGLCFEIPEQSLNAFCLLCARNEERFRQKIATIRKVLKIRYVLTHVVAPLTGIAAIVSGIELTARGGYSFTEGWLFWMLCAASLGVYKGIYQHNSYIRKLLVLSRTHDDEGRECFRRGILSPFDQPLIMLELPTYIFNFWTASVKPLWMAPCAGVIAQLEHFGSPWLAGVVIILAGSLWLFPLNYGMRRYSVVFKNKFMN